jgi:hypothetical protein
MGIKIAAVFVLGDDQIFNGIVERGLGDVEFLSLTIGILAMLDSLDSPISYLVKNQVHARKTCNSDMTFIMDRNITVKAIQLGFIPLFRVLIKFTDPDKAGVIDVYYICFFVTF